jgi:hypothetical protein
MKTSGNREAPRIGPIVMMLIAVTAAAAQFIRFEHVQRDLFSTGGAFVNAWADADGDGDLDQFVGFDGARNRLYRNNNGRFDDVAVNAGLADARPTRAAAWGDADADGDPDLLVGFAPASGPPTTPADPAATAKQAAAQPSSVLKFYRNTRSGFRDETAAVGLTVEGGAVRQPVWVDYDGDGDLDLFVAFRDRANAMYRNDNTRFVDIAPQVGLDDSRRTVGAVWFDYDEDGDLDVITGNMDGDANGLFSQERGKFTDVAEIAGVAWGGRTPQDKANGTVRPCVADVNGDGHLDVFFANYGRNGLFLNRGGGRFEDVSKAWGVDIDARYDSCAFADIDNDGYLDLYVNGTVTGGKQYDDYLFRNTGTAFENVTPAEIGSPNSDHGVQWVDFDFDGDMDLSLTGVQKDGMHWLLRNTLPAADSPRLLNLRILDAAGRATLAGAEVSVRLGIAPPSMRQQTRLVDAGSGYNTQNDAPIAIVLPNGPDVTLTVSVRRPGTTIVSTRAIDPRQWRNRVYQLQVTR